MCFYLHIGNTNCEIVLYMHSKGNTVRYCKREVFCTNDFQELVTASYELTILLVQYCEGVFSQTFCTVEKHLSCELLIRKTSMYIK